MPSSPISFLSPHVVHAPVFIATRPRQVTHALLAHATKTEPPAHIELRIDGGRHLDTVTFDTDCFHTSLRTMFNPVLQSVPKTIPRSSLGRFARPPAPVVTASRAVTRYTQKASSWEWWGSHPTHVGASPVTKEFSDDKSTAPPIELRFPSTYTQGS